VSALLLELARVLALLPLVERGMHRLGPGPLLARLRERGRHTRARSPEGRERLRRAIRWLDARCPGGASCYRRCLLETGLDPDAARTKVVMALSAAGGDRSGHAWLEGSPPGDGRYDALVHL
jgi:hypothetical protein